MPTAIRLANPLQDGGRGISLHGLAYGCCSRITMTSGPAGPDNATAPVNRSSGEGTVFSARSD